ncbi:MAG: hypothetical protein IPO07_10975 [Haliscomenobacter sp.]|nr:hypothetical protein [Haliscomenobacter sp.]MBK9489249.1 hypothetical protein [Haliscomenobacter sp.]
MEDALHEQYQVFVGSLMSTYNVSNERSWTKIVDNLFNDFGALEIGAGFQSLFATYYTETPDSTTAILVRFGSAPKYNQLWGAEWNVWASFKGSINAQQSETRTTTGQGFQPFLAGGSVSFQYRPEIPFAKGVMRLITGVGANIEAYMPARINPNLPALLTTKEELPGLGQK